VELPADRPKKGLLARLWSGLVGAEQAEPSPVAIPAARDKPAEKDGQKSQGNNRRRRSSQDGEQRSRNQEGRGKEARSDDKREQPRRQRQEGSGRGNGQGRRRGGRDGQRRRPDAVEEAANEVLESVAQEAPDTQDGQDTQDKRDKPRKRPSDMKRGEPQRRRRNRSRKTENDAAESGAANADVSREDQSVVAASAKPLQEADASPVEGTASATPATAPEIATGQTELPLEVTEATVIETPAAEPEVAAVEPAVAAPVAKPETAIAKEPAPLQEATKGAGLTETGRAYNDPRVEPRPVGVVEIVTAHPALFSDFVAPPVQPSGKVVLRASNDPRGPAPQEQQFAEASGQS
jgi:ribonuclease E